MLTEQMRAVVERVEQLPPETQNKIAAAIEDALRQATQLTP